MSKFFFYVINLIEWMGAYREWYKKYQELPRPKDGDPLPPPEPPPKRPQ
jgi:hypothetical protein